MRRPPLDQHTPAGRIAAVAVNASEDIYDRTGYHVDFADLQDVLKPWMAREILIARIAEAKTCERADRVAELQARLDLVQIPN